MAQKITDAQETLVRNVKAISERFNELEVDLKDCDEARWIRTEGKNIIQVVLPEKRKLYMSFKDDKCIHLKSLAVYHFDKRFYKQFEMIVKKPEAKMTECTISYFNQDGNLIEAPQRLDYVQKHQGIKNSAVYVNRVIPFFGELRFDIRTWGLSRVYYQLDKEPITTVKLQEDHSAIWKMGGSSKLLWILLGLGAAAVAAGAYFFLR
ncbi:MAG: hypothetical protein HQL32_11285 [Planctomycetes bacterium]|nr:hypothetical protein [Planctomycetota bacterium]